MKIGNRIAPVLYAGAAPGFAGLMQVNVRIPAFAPKGDKVPVVLRVGKFMSQEGVTIAVE